MNIHHGIVRLTGLALLAALALPAQVLNGRIEVSVLDPSGQVIAGAKASLKDLRKQAAVGGQITTDTTGVAVFPAVPPSVYEVIVEAPGFRKSIVSGFELNSSQTLRQSVMLEIGSVTEAVQVEANAVAINTADATISRTINMTLIDSLPQLNRSPLGLIAFSPGVSIRPDDTTFSRVNGLRQGSNNSRLDGIDVNDAVVPRLGLSMTAVNTDSVEEVRIVTNGGKAEYGRNAGGQVEMVTRSGSNEWHGNGFDLLRNTVLNANTFFNNASGVARPVFIQNYFGGSGGGRILRNKLFFFGNYQGRRTSQGVTRNRTVLTPEAKLGIFRYQASSISPILSYNIPQNDPTGRGIDPQMKLQFAQLPDPNNFDAGDGLNTAGFRFNVPAPTREDQGTGKLDYQMTDTHRLFFRYSRQFNESIDSLNNAEQTYPGQPNGAQGGVRWGFAVGSDWTIATWLINEFRIGRQSATTDFIRPYRDGGPAIISNLYTDPMNSALGQGRNSPVIDLTDNVTLIKGKHTYKAGVNFHRTLQYGYNYGGIFPNVSLSRASAGNAPPASVGPSGLTSAQRTVFEGLFNDVLGRVGNIAQTFYSNLSEFQPAGSPRVRNTRFRDLGIFFQDDWKVRPNLTLNLGLRWENFGVPTEINGFQGFLDKVDQINTVSQISNMTVQKAGKWYNPDRNNFAPRFGFAWDPFKDGKTSIRGSWGIFYDRVIGATANSVDGGTPGFSLALTTFPNQNGTTTSVNSLQATDYPAKPGSPTLTLPNNRNTTIYAFNPNLRTGYVQQFNFNVQRQITRHTVVDLGFVRTSGTKLFAFLDMNQPKIFGDFLSSFKELQANLTSLGNVNPNNTLARIFGSAATAISTLGSTNIRDGLAGTVADNLDRSYYSRFAGAGVSDFYIRNFPQYNRVWYGNNVGNSNYNSLQTSIVHRTRNVLLQANYTFSKALDNFSDEGNAGTDVVDHWNLNLNKARADFDRPHAFNWTASYKLPFGRGQRWLGSTNAFVDRVLGHWEIGTLGALQSGSVFSVTTGRRTVGSLLNTYANYSGDRSAAGNVDVRGNGVFYFSPEEVGKFTFNNAGEYGNSGRNAFRGPKYFNTDISVVKRIPVTEAFRMTYRLEMYNAFNNVMFQNPAITSIITPATLGRISGTNPQRIMQMALRFDF